MNSSKKKPAGQKRIGLKGLIAGLILLAVYEAALAVIAQRLLEKDLKNR